MITWPFEAGIRDARWARCFFAIRAVVAAHARRYERDFGVTAGFTAAR